jgi:hypothetical protein
MRVVALVLALILTLGTAARAAPSFVQSGEHEGFTRLVAELPDGAGWRVRRDAGQVILSLTGHNDGFDISRVFDLIPRDRVAALGASNDSLVITMGCDCAVSAFAVGNTHVALDIASPGVALDTPLIPPAAPALPFARPIPPAARPAGDTAPAAVTREPLSPAAKAALMEVQETLLRELGAAATQGLLDAGPTIPPMLEQRPQVDPAAFDPPAAPITPAPEEGPRTVNIRVTSSMDLPPGQHGLGAMLDSIRSCPPKGALAVSDWGDDRAFHIQLGEARQQLYGEFDQLDRTGALRLARLYLHFGFGAEAADILALDPAVIIDNPLLPHVAAVMENGIAQTPHAFDAVAGCDGDTALWALLSGTPPGEEDADLVKKALLAMNDLPAHLRGHLAPALSRALLARKDTVGAAQALRSIERLSDELPGPAELAQAHLKEKQGETDAATGQFEKIVAKNSEESPEALIALINAHTRSREPVNIEIVELAETYAIELEDSPLGPDLSHAYIAALALAGQYDRAFAEMEGVGPEDSGAADLYGHLVRELTETAPEVTFLRYAFGILPQKLAGLSPPIRIAFARRMFDAGFAAAAQEVIAALPDRPLNEERQLLAAEVALALAQPLRAQAELLGVDDPRVTRLLADAKRMAGTYAEAHDLYLQAGEEARATQTAWLAEEWRSLTPADAPVFGPAVALDPDARGTEVDEGGMLARSAEALAESESARQTLIDLLGASELQLAPPVTN